MKMNLPNKLVLLRMALVPVVAVLILWPGAGLGQWIAALVVFCGASITDALDGRIARKTNQVTNFGKLMDPLADKLLVCVTMICLSIVDILPAWLTLIVVAREFLVSGLRMLALEQQKVIAASKWGKAKTVAQMSTVILVMLYAIARCLAGDAVAGTVWVWTQIDATIAAALTIWSMVDYGWKNRQVWAVFRAEEVERQESPRRKFWQNWPLYYVADILTAARGVCVIIIIIMTIVGAGPGAVLIVFVLGELTDAFDGEAARRWHYPDDGKRRWWRKYAVILDQVADIALGVVAVIYIGVYFYPWYAALVLIVGVAVGLPIQIWRNYRIRIYGPNDDDDPLRKYVILARRIGGYLLALVATALILLIVTPLTPMSKVLILVHSAILAVPLIILKMPRLQHDKTPL